jgi:hypothetical protein
MIILAMAPAVVKTITTNQQSRAVAGLQPAQRR